MAAPITHLFFAEKFCEKHEELERFPFFVGNCLPDIRHIDKKISRDKFHFFNVSIEDIKKEKLDFRKGIKFHSFIDEERDLFYKNEGIYTPTKESDELFIVALKLLEDEILYEKIQFLGDFASFFQKYEFPIDGIDNKSIKKWKELLHNYFQQKPCQESRKEFMI